MKLLVLFTHLRTAIFHFHFDLCQSLGLHTWLKPGIIPQSYDFEYQAYHILRFVSITAQIVVGGFCHFGGSSQYRLVLPCTIHFQYTDRFLSI